MSRRHVDVHSALTWSWHCDHCRQAGWGYRTQDAARTAALHHTCHPCRGAS